MSLGDQRLEGLSVLYSLLRVTPNVVFIVIPEVIMAVIVISDVGGS